MRREDVTPVGVGESGAQYAWWRGLLVDLAALAEIGRLAPDERDEVHRRLLRRLGR